MTFAVGTSAACSVSSSLRGPCDALLTPPRVTRYVRFVVCCYFFPFRSLLFLFFLFSLSVCLVFERWRARMRVISKTVLPPPSPTFLLSSSCAIISPSFSLPLSLPSSPTGQVRQMAPWHARAWLLPGPLPIRGGLHVLGAHRGRHRRHHRGGQRGV